MSAAARISIKCDIFCTICAILNILADLLIVIFEWLREEHCINVTV